MENKFCSKCGMSLANDDVFCSKCGTKVILEEGVGSYSTTDSSKIISDEAKADTDVGLKTGWGEFKKTIKIAFGVLEIIALIIIVGLFASGKFNLFITDFLALINPTNDNPYIEMVQSLKPYDSMSYGSAFDAEFDYNEWSYFKSDGCRIVQVVSRYNDISDKMITQFSLTPQDDEQFYIEPYAVNVSGKNLSDFEINLVIAAIFKNDLSQVLFDLTSNSTSIPVMQHETKNGVNEYGKEKETQEKTLQEERKSEEIDALKSKIEEIDNEISDINRDIDNYNNEILEYEREIQESTNRIAELENELYQLENSPEVLAGTAPDGVWRRINDVKQYIENNKMTINNRKLRLENLKGEHNTTRIAQYEEKIKTLELEKKEIMKKLNN